MISLLRKGAGTALVTPFCDDDSVDYDAMRALVARQVEAGIDMLIPCGTTGEAVTLLEEEHQRIIELVVREVAGRVPVIAGAGSNSTSTTIRNAKMAAEAGADAVLVVGPYYNKPTQEGYYQHFRAVADAVDIGVVLYNVPGRTSGNIDASTQLRLAQIDNVIAIKEASANFSQIMDVLHERPPGFAVLSGDDNLVLPQIAIGIDGVISVAANEIPGEFAAMVRHALNGEYEQARTLHYRYLRLMEINFIESNPIPVKTALAMMGLIREQFRLPLLTMQAERRNTLEQTLRNLSLIQ
jgi:4-hydroxy-tetrahydrodipicolinate synthase